SGCSLVCRGACDLRSTISKDTRHSSVSGYNAEAVLRSSLPRSAAALDRRAGRVEPKSTTSRTRGAAGGSAAAFFSAAAGSVLAVVIVALATIVAFLPVLNNEFLDWDDGETLVTNFNYRGLGWTQLTWMFTAHHMGHWLPLTWISFGLDYLIWGMNPF